MSMPYLNHRFRASIFQISALDLRQAEQCHSLEMTRRDKLLFAISAVWFACVVGALLFALFTPLADW